MKMRREEEKKKKMVAEIGSRAAAKEKEDGGKTVVVGVKMDPQSRELLTWYLVKVVSPGDRVIALHVLTPSSLEASDSDGKPSSLISLVKAFDSVLAVYEGFCNLKQIDLKPKICRGSSIRKVLVREASAYAANALILGVAGNNSIIGSSSTSIAKYCAKKLSKECLVLAVNNGKVVYQREASPASGNQEKSKASNLDMPTSLVCTIRRSVSRNSSKLSRGWSSGSLHCHLHDRDQSGSDSDASNSPVHTLEDASQRGSCFVCRTSNAIEWKDNSLALVPVKNSGTASNSLLLAMQQPREVRSGWSLLRRAIMNNNRNNSMEKPKVSVVQRAMWLPSRYSASAAVHPDRKPLKPELKARAACDAESKAIVPVGTHASTPLVEVYVEEVKLPKELESLQEKYSSLCRLFSYEELMQATSNFSPEKFVGKGGSSSVFKGHLLDGKEVAVKILKHSDDALKEFTSEIEIITNMHHKNIISLYGFCFENDNLILVYDFFARGSLEECLHGEQDNKIVLSWIERFKIASGIAEALDYLHGNDNDQPVIHRDVKSSNILLRDDFEPQLSDFGLAKWAKELTFPITCNDVAGTFGYLAPEYFMYGKVTEKIDVYAFGVVLLELLSGRKPISNGCSKDHESLVLWAEKILREGKFKLLIDPSFGDEYDDDQMERVILAASLCIRRDPHSRPRISLVLKLLQGDEDVLKWAKKQARSSEEFDSLHDGETIPTAHIQSYINLALLDVDEDLLSVSSINSTATNTSMEGYLQGRRWGHSSSSSSSD